MSRTGAGGETRITAEGISALLGGRFHPGAGAAGDPVIAGYCIDSRRARPGSLFFALPGDTVDGFDFQADAWRRGAACMVTETGRDAVRAGLSPDSEWPVIEVENPLEALHSLAARVRRDMNPFTVAISGSNGKTTTKDMTAAILSEIVPVLATPGNENSQVGVPLAILRLEKHHRAAIIETGMSREGELAKLAALADPDIILLTNIGPAHLETLGSLEAVARAKFELIPGRGEGKVVLLNADDPVLRAKADELSGAFDGAVITFGLERGDVKPDKVVLKPDGRFELYTGRWGRLDAPLPGRHNAYNALAAVLVSSLLGATSAEIETGLGGARISGLRMEESSAGGVGILNDAYNANPVSVAAAVGTLRDTRTRGRRFLVLGEMLELGSGSGEMHRAAARAAAAAGIDGILLVGACWREHLAGETGGDRWDLFDETGEAVDFLSDRLRPGDLVLIKGSRGARLELAAADLETRLRETGNERVEGTGDAG